MKRLLFIALLVVFGCEDKEKDCAGVEGGNNICGCTASTATNYDSTATFDDTTCIYLPNCIDDIDNDCDGLIDTADPDCAGDGSGEYLRVNCNDDIDNDGDGLIDCDDPKCQEGGMGEFLVSVSPPPFAPMYPVHYDLLLIVSHYSGQRICSNSTASIQAMAIESEVIEKVEFYIDDILIYTDSDKPYIFDWDCTSYNNGSHSVKVMSYNLSGESKDETINLNIEDMPSIEIDADNSYFEYVKLDVNAESCIGIYDLTFYINDSLVQSFIPPDHFPGYCYYDAPADNIIYLPLPATQFQHSSYTIKATASDINGNIAVSNTVEVNNCHYSEVNNCLDICIDNCEYQLYLCDQGCCCPNPYYFKYNTWNCYLESEIIEEFWECFIPHMNQNCPMVICCEGILDNCIETYCTNPN